MSEEIINKEEHKEEILKKIVLINLETIPPNYKLSLGKTGVFDKHQF